MTPDQKLAAWDRGIRTLLIRGKHPEAAEAAGVNAQTWHNWRKDEAWKRLFEIRREQAASVSSEEMGALFQEAREVLHEAMGSDHRIEVRLKAASKVADLIVRKNDLSSVSPAIAALAVEVSGSDAASELRRRRELQANVPVAALPDHPPSSEEDPNEPADF